MSDLTDDRLREIAETPTMTTGRTALERDLARALLARALLADREEIARLRRLNGQQSDYTIALQRLIEWLRHDEIAEPPKGAPHHTKIAVGVRERIARLTRERDEAWHEVARLREALRNAKAWCPNCNAGDCVMCEQIDAALAPKEETDE